ncbi:periplasmic binding protein-like I [Entophlyctis helioformis]|nr:periplasmic binding protein-like I [Entophlyctis helioformis]
MRHARAVVLLSWMAIWTTLLPLAACVRSSNKSETTLTFVVVGESSISVDPSFFGARMAAAEVNRRTDIMPDATIEVVRYPDILAYDERTAAVVDNAVQLCDTPGLIGSTMELASVVVIKALLVCKTLPTFSIGSASDVLSDKEKYPLYWRYTSTWGQTIQASVSIFKYFGWTKTAVVYINYGTFARVGKLIVDVLPKNGIDVAAKVSLEPYQAPGRYYDQIRPSFEYLKSTKLRVFIIIGLDTDIPLVMMAANATGMIGPDYVWITPQTYASITTETEAMWGGPIDRSVLTGVSFLSNDQTPPTANTYLDAWKLRFEAAVQNMIANEAALYPAFDFNDTNPMSERNPLFVVYDDLGKWEVIASGAKLTYDGLMTLITVWDNVINQHNTTAQAVANGSLHDAIILPDILKVASRHEQAVWPSRFTPVGDLSADPMIIMQYNDNFDLVTVGVLRVDDETGMSALTVYDSFNWTGGRRRDDVPIDFPIVVYNAAKWDQLETRILLAIYAVSTLLCIASGRYIWLHQSARGIFHRTPILLCISAVGMTIALANTLTLIGGVADTLRCRFRAWPLTLGLTLILSCIIAKSYRMHVIFRCMRADSGFERHTVTIARLLNLIGATFLFMLAPLSLQAAFFPYVTSEVYIESADTYNLACVSVSETTNIITAILMIVLGGMLVTAAVFAYINRILPNNYNDVKEITISVYVITTAAVVGLAQGYLGSQSATFQFRFESVLVMGCIMVLNATLLGLPILKSIRSRRAANAQRRLVAKKMAEKSGASDMPGSHSAQPQMWEHFDAENETVLRIVGSTAHQSRTSHVTRGNIYRSDKVMALSTTSPYPRAITLTLVSEPLFIFGFMDAATEEPRYVPLKAIRSVKIPTSSDELPWMQNALELQVRDKTVMFIFESTEERGCWADAIASCMIRHWGATHLESTGQILNVREVAIFQVGA